MVRKIRKTIIGPFHPILPRLEGLTAIIDMVYYAAALAEAVESGAVPIGAGANTCALGGWPAGSPSYTAVLKQYGVENPYRDSINNDKVYWIDNHIDWTISYLHEYYDDQVQAKQIGTFDEKYAMYQLVSGKEEQN